MIVVQGYMSLGVGLQGYIPIGTAPTVHVGKVFRATYGIGPSAMFATANAYAATYGVSSIEASL